MKRILRAVIGLTVCATLLIPTSVSAAGSAGISGSATQDVLTWYYTPRTVTNPATAGPEVAFNKASGPSGLNLGTHNCDQTGGGPLYLQATGLWRPVRYYSAPQTFCMLTTSSQGSGSFSGTLAWD